MKTGIKCYKLVGDRVIEANNIEDEFKKGPSEKLLRRELNLFGVNAEVSTVFLKVDHGTFDDDEPVVFETMVFSNVPELDRKFQDRYSKLNEAIVGHTQMILIVSAFLKKHADAKLNRELGL